MGRGKSWDLEENAVLAGAWISASEDPVVGADQKAKMFFETMHRRFIEKGPPTASVVDGKYGFRTVESCRKHVAELSADVQKFGIALRKIRACNPTGVQDADIISMAVAVHMGKATTMDYETKDYCKENWLSYKAWKVWNTHPKWSMSQASDEASSTPHLKAAIPVTQGDHADTSDELEGNTRDEQGVRRASPSKSVERFGLGTRNAKLIRQEELRTQAVRSMAESAKRKSDALEERNAIAVFSRPEATSMPETAHFFAAVRQTYLSQALKKARMASEESESAVAAIPECAPDLPAVSVPAESAPLEVGEPVLTPVESPVVL